MGAEFVVWIAPKYLKLISRVKKDRALRVGDGGGGALPSRGSDVPACSVSTVRAPCTASCDRCGIWNVSPSDAEWESSHRQTPGCSTCINLLRKLCWHRISINKQKIYSWPNSEGQFKYFLRLFRCIVKRIPAPRFRCLLLLSPHLR